MSLVRCVFAWTVPVPLGFRCPAHAHASTEIVFSDGAEGTLWQGGTAYAYRNRSVFVYQPGGEHWIENTKAGEHICIGVVGCGADQLAPGVWSSDDALTTRFREIRRILQKPPLLQPVRLDLLAGLVACDLVSLLPNHPQASPGKKSLSRAHRVRDYIESTLNEHLSLIDLANRVYVSPDYLRQLFREEFGESITRYIVRRRIELAADLLRSTEDPVKAIAAQAGFSSEYYFSRMFRKMMGQPPSAWRRTSRH